MNMFGEAKPKETDFTRIETLPPLPRVEVYRSQDVANPDAESIEQLGVDANHAYAYSVMQSGEQVIFRLAGSDGAFPGAPRIYEGEQFTTALNSESELFTYTFPHYPELADASLFAWKDVFVVFESPDSVISCYIPVYRALYGNINLPGGLILLLSIVTVSAGVVLFKGRRRAL
jgi:hypothetical protein